MNENERKFDEDIQVFQQRICPEYPAENIKEEIKSLLHAYLALEIAIEAPKEEESFKAVEQEANIRFLKTWLASSLNAIAKHHKVDLFAKAEMESNISFETVKEEEELAHV